MHQNNQTVGKMNVRLKLSDFINTEYESIIMDKISEVHKKLDATFYLRLWFDGDIKAGDLKEFMKKYEEGLEYKTIISATDKLTPNEFVWFDITSKSYPHSVDNSRYGYSYPAGNPEGILLGLDEFYNVASFTVKPKPQKQYSRERKQKRNDY
tara:strand:+ start:72 stop:530 length:459 start_codon:yes stop_codon:yes gene_type:complete